MTNEEFQNKVNDFFQKNKYFKLIDVIAADDKHHECQVCGNRRLKKLVQVRNDERNEEWFVGWNCWEAVETLQEQEEKARFKEIVKCSECGKEQLRGQMSASCPELCVECCCKKLNLPDPYGESYKDIKPSWSPEPIKGGK